jgi:isopentenyl diphosphate isomerase/L-lactate dehydrogenase-like FMN-dependent dehydrogenase
VLEIMDNEFTTIMRQVGAFNINQITRDNVTRA